MTTQAFIPDAVQYSRKRVLTLTWTDQDGIPIDLTAATLAGVIDRRGTHDYITGTLTVTGASTGTFTWTFSARDVATAGSFLVQFYARYASGGPEISYRTAWRVLPSHEFAFVSPSMSPSASVSPSASESA